MGSALGSGQLPDYQDFEGFGPSEYTTDNQEDATAAADEVYFPSLLDSRGVGFQVRQPRICLDP